MSSSVIVRAIVGGLISAVAAAIPLASKGSLNLLEWLSITLAGLVGTGLTAYSPSGGAQPSAEPLVQPGLIGEVEKVVEEVAPVVESVLPQAAPVVNAIEGALPGATQFP